MNLQELTRFGLFQEIVEAIHRADDAQLILASIGYPRGGRPRYPRSENWQPFWEEICTSIESGRLASGTDLQPLVDAVARKYPANSLLQRYKSQEHPPPPFDEGNEIDLDAACLRRLYLSTDVRPLGTLRTDAKLAGVPELAIPTTLGDAKYFERALEELQKKDSVQELFVAALRSWPQDEELRSNIRIISGQFDSPASAAPYLWQGLKASDRKALVQIWGNLRIRIVLVMDLIGYSDKARELEEHLGASVVLRFNDQIQEFVDKGLNAAGISRENAVFAITGDGAILLFDTALAAHQFAQAVHSACRERNEQLTLPSAERWFRMGAAAGEIAIREDRGKREMAGITISNAVRLETAGERGHLLIDIPTYDRLPEDVRRQYLPEEEVAGKREEWFKVRRCMFLGDAPLRRDHVVLSLKLSREEFTDVAAQAFVRELAAQLNVKPAALVIEGLKSGSVEVVIRFKDEADLAQFINMHVAGDAGLRQFFDTWKVQAVRYHAALAVSAAIGKKLDAPTGAAAPASPEQKAVYVDKTFAESTKFEPEAILLTAAPIELATVLERLRPAYHNSKGVWRVSKDQHTYFLGKFGRHNVAVTKCDQGALSMGGAIQAARSAIECWKPKAIIMVGIAMGRSEANQKMGDVLIASQVISYEVQRVGRGPDGQEEKIQRGPIAESSLRLRDRFASLGNSWSFRRPDGSQCAKEIGAILSGEKLVDNANFKSRLFKQFPQAIGGEMEGVGLYTAAAYAGIDWILVKAICDWGDGHKHDGSQPLAAQAAVSLVEFVFSQRNLFDGASRKA